LSVTICKIKKLFCLFGLALALFQTSAQAGEQKKVFILHSYSQEYQWTKRQHEGFVKTLKEQYKQPIEISTEYFDTKRVQLTPEYQKNFLLYLSMKYKNYAPDVVYVSDDDALNFMMANREKLFSNTPVVFSGINNLALQETIDKKRYVGVYELKEIEPNIKLIQMFAPQTKHIWFVGDASITYDSILAEIQEESKKFSNVSFHFVSSKKLDTVLGKLESAPANSFVLLTTIGGFVDANGNNVTLQESIGKLSKLKNIILLSMEDAYIQGGVIGGYVTDGSKQGSLAAKMALQALTNTPITKIESITKSSNSYIFNRKELVNSKLILSEYTARNAIIFNEEESFYIRHQELIRNAFLVLFALVILSFTIIYFISKEKKQALEEERKRYKAILEFASDGIHLLDENGYLVEFSDSFARMLGYAQEEMHGINISQIDVLIPKETIIETVRSLTNSSTIIETKHRRKDGSIIDVEVNAKGIMLDGKTYLYASARDITDKKAQENIIKEGEISYRELFNSINHAVYIQDLNGVFVDVNDGVIDMYGYSKSELIGKTPDFLSADGKNDLDEIGRHIVCAIDGKAQRFEYWGKRKNGEIFPKDVSLVRGRYFGQDVLIAVGVDITKQKQLEQNLQALVEQEMQKRLEKEKMLNQQSKMAMMGEMIAMIAHQWRQPLNALAINIQDAEIAYTFGEITDEYIKKFKQDSMSVIQNMSKTIDDFRDFFKPTKEKESFDVELAIEQTMRIMGSILQNNNIEVNLPQGEIKHAMYGYKNELEQVLLILISNAKDVLVELKASNPRIDVAVKTAGDNRIEITVNDNGGGIPEHILDRIFEPYFTTKEQGKGTGIGLYMAKEIIERQMGGKITAENIDDGARFSVVLKSSFN
jgi:PAS domain S-box-containing protein